MADGQDALLAALLGGAVQQRGYPDLDQFTNTLAANDLWKMAAAPVLGTKFNTSTWSNGETLAATAGQAFLGSILKGLGDRSEAQQLAKTAAVLPQLYSNPGSVLVPEGVDAEAFGKLKLSALKENAARTISTDTKTSDARERLFADVFSRSPGLAVQTMPEMAKKFDIKIPEPSKQEDTKPTERIQLGGLSSGSDSTLEKVSKYARFLQEQDPSLSSTQAMISARQQVQGEIAANSKTFDEGKEAREYGQKLLDLASTAKAGMSQAGKTGSFQTLRHALDYVGAAAGNEDSAKKILGDSVLSSVAPDLVRLSRSPGAVSDYETKLYLGSGPSVNNTPEANAILAQKMEDLGKLNVDYADFLEAYRQVNSGSTVGAAKKWAEYRQAFPIFKENGNAIELNSNRPSWQEFFNGEQAAPTGAREQALAILRQRGAIP